jgi:hypothetical protein
MVRDDPPGIQALKGHAMTRRRLRVIPVLWISAWALLAASVPAGATTLTWSVVPSPSPGSGYNVLSAVSCVSSAACTAVGLDREDTAPYAFHTLAEAWNGTRWSVVPSPTPGGVVGVNLNGVSCVSPAACMAVGYYETSSGGESALIESWNGTSWSVVPSRHPASSNVILHGVSCVSAAACTAVGSFYHLHSGTIETFVESWNGATWSVVPSPGPASGGNVLSAVSCVSAAACTAVGYDYEAPTLEQTLVESWNGATWSVVPSPNRPQSNDLVGVSCVSATACMAVGSHGDHRVNRALTESWNGATWSLVTSPNPGTTHDALVGVSCSLAAACTTVGTYSGASVVKTLVESWNGTRWSVVPSPTPGSADDLNGVSCASAAACTAVGSNGRKTLIESGS